VSALWVLVRVVLVALALVVLIVTIVYEESPSGTTLVPGGVVIDLVALAVALACVISLLRDVRGRR
jgi:hypothetical protein